METTPAAELDRLRAEAAHLRRVNQELLATVAELRATVEKQQAHIERLVRLTFGRRSERLTGPTLFDGLAGPEPTPEPEPGPTPPPEPATSRRGHGRRCRPADLPREEVILDLTETEKACPCCGTLR